MDGSQLGRALVLIGLGLVVVGGLVWGLTRLNLPFGRLPGDFAFGSDGFRVSIPLATSIVISLVLTVVVNLIAWFGRR